ncbi:nitric oxide synthase [Riemerella anatipestifer]|uniref:PepSY domain-containing protein n=1 Tax=Riemerella anatipestifer TaxID=34085 RepID=UPI001AD7B77E|nr:PepSY domain-containing protein [Riemerella anatipestifer]MBO4234322.1 nitric oxide synthase [Riemerella anatipestifer]
MKTAIWRYLHLGLACSISTLLIIASVTGGILALDEMVKKSEYKAHQFPAHISISDAIKNIKPSFSEIQELKVEQQVLIVEGFNQDLNTVVSITNPSNGKLIAPPRKSHQWVNWANTLHRSLFLHELGRGIIGATSCLFLLSILSGGILLYRRQGNRLLHNAKTNTKVDFIHFIGGKWLGIPLFIIAFTGSILFLFRFEVLRSTPAPVETFKTKSKNTSSPSEFEIFKNTPLTEVKKLSFPLFEDEEEYYKLTTKQATFTINQFTGEIISKQNQTPLQNFEGLNKAIHTGEIHFIWALVLFFSSLSIPLFIFSGILLWWRRKKKKIKNPFQANQAEYIILAGTDGGTTLEFANKIHQQFLDLGLRSYLTEMNHYTIYPKGRFLLCFASTYGDGEAPSSAIYFEKKLNTIVQPHKMKYSIVGFGSINYPKYNAYATHIASILEEKETFENALPLVKVNQKSPTAFLEWVQYWNEYFPEYQLNTSESFYRLKLKKKIKLKVLDKTEVCTHNQLFKINLKPLVKVPLRSGDLLEITPMENQPRLYSVAKQNNSITLWVKLIPNGLGSNFLYNLTIGDKLKATPIQNKHFRFPKKAKSVHLISNGTGIAPFLGMIAENTSLTKIYLYGGFRHRTSIISEIEKDLNHYIKNNQLASYQLAFSRDTNGNRITKYIIDDLAQIITSLENGGTMMVCGSVEHLSDIETAINNYSEKHHTPNYTYFKNNHQILSDVY